MRVYKFLDARWGEEAIRRQRIKISLFTELNDPYEGKCIRLGKMERAAWNSTFLNFSKTHGIVCFSDRWDNPVLWSHYSDLHRGLCLGFDIDASIPIMRVEYSNDLLDGGILTTGQRDEQIQLVKRVYSTKFTDWQYESEYRAFCDLDEPDRHTGMHFVDFSQDFKLSEVIFGARFQGDAPYIHSTIPKVSDVKFTTARLAFNYFAVVEQKNKRLQL